MDAITPSESPLFTAPRFRCRRLLLVALALLALNFGGAWLVAQLNFQIWPRHNDMIELIVVAMFFSYIFIMMLPFVPGIEIGIAIMLMTGQGGIVLVYLCTQIALALSFLIGRMVPKNAMHSFLHSLCSERATAFIEELGRTSPLLPAQRIAGRTPPHWFGRWFAVLMQNRYLALAVILNLPGNAVVGGAGGIGAIAGMSRLFRFPGYVLTVALATTPLPVIFLLSSVS